MNWFVELLWGHPWLPTALTLLFWAIIIFSIAAFRRFDKSRSDSSRQLAVVVPSTSKLHFPECCVCCGAPIDGDARVTVAASIEQGILQTSLSSLPGDITGQAVVWEIPCCDECASDIELDPPEWSMLIYGLFSVLWLISIILAFDIVVGAMGYGQLFWLIPFTLVSFVLVLFTASLISLAIQFVWQKLFRHDISEGTRGKSRAQNSVNFSIDRIFPPGDDGGRWVIPPHEYNFTFKNQDYGREFEQLNGGESKLVY